MIAEQPDFISLAAFNKAAGDVLRLEVLRVLAQDAYGVLELCDIFETRQSGMSHHLKVLAESGLVAKRREGNSIFYSRALPAGELLAKYQQQLYAAIDAQPLSVKIAEQVAEVKRVRAEQSQRFFEQNGAKFKAQQDLIAEYPIYGEAVAELLAQTPLQSRDLAIEVGPGEGEFLPELAKSFKKVVALDNATVMLDSAEAFCRHRGVNNVEFVNGDTSVLGGKPQADCVVMNMVLHHTPSPASIFSDISASLKIGGALIVTELCHHDQDWAKTACGDLWLGFDPDQLQHWAALSNLSNTNSQYFALRNGFQIQLQQFIKNS